MSSGSIKIPSKFIKDTSLSPAQKIILSYISENQNSYLLNIAKGIGTRRTLIESEIKQLVDQNRVFTSNGTGRVKYSTIKGLGFEANSVDEKATSSFSKEKLHTTKKSKLRIKNNNYNYNLNLKYGSGELAIKAVEYWTNNGGMKHRMGTATYEKSIELLIKLFEGKAFKQVPDDAIPFPKLNKIKKFSIEDWMSAIDHLNIAMTDPRYKPYNKEKALKWRKKLTLPTFIYNPFGREGQSRSMFLVYVKGAELLNQEKEIYPEFTRELTKAFDRIALQLRPHPTQIISIANKLPLLAKKHRWKWVSKSDAAKVFTDFIVNHFGELRFSPFYMSAPWFIFEFEKYLDQQGLITLYE